MSFKIKVSALSVTLFLFISTYGLLFQSSWAAEVGKAAPEFSIQDSTGKTHHLKDYLGKIVVLEWANHGCPFVRKHYDSNNMQRLQKSAKDEGVVWLTVISSAPGKQGHFNSKEAHDHYFNKERSLATAVLLDPTGSMGKLYDAKTTPHMYVIDSKGVLTYAGAIDDTPSTDSDDIPKSKNYIRMTLDALKAGKKPVIATTDAYGCSVKY